MCPAMFQGSRSMKPVSMQHKIDVLPDFSGKVVTATGHRPHKLGGYAEVVDWRLMKLARAVLDKSKPARVISGMALGWDQAIAFVGITLGIPVTAAIPFEGQESIWPESKQSRYHAILKKCESVQIVSPGEYGAHKMYIRNCWMVDRADVVLALWDGTPGGTANCIDYTLENSHAPIVNVWDLWRDIYSKMDMADHANGATANFWGT